MKKIVFLIVLVTLNPGLFAQKWKTVNKEFFGITYKLPGTWEVDGFGGEDWEAKGSSVCHCAGIINIINRSDSNEIYMLVYPTKIKDSVNAVKRKKIWKNIVGDKVTDKSTVPLKNYTFEKAVLKFDEGAQADFPGYEIWRFFTFAHEQYYTVYFWAKPQTIKDNEKDILKILESIRITKVK